jgi:hypothetical protein
MNFLFQVVIPAISGLVSGTIASLVAPWINWRIEQKREKLAYKKEMIRRWRQFLDRKRDFDESELLDSAVYSEMRPHLSSRTVQSIESDTIDVQVGRGGYVIRSLILDDISRLEEEWDLI